MGECCGAYCSDVCDCIPKDKETYPQDIHAHQPEGMSNREWSQRRTAQMALDRIKSNLKQ